MPKNRSDLAGQIPFLRRYARLVTGSQTRGDRYVAVTLESLLAETARLEEANSPRVELYRCFHETWEKLIAQIDPQGHGEEETESRLEGQVMALSPLERQALLLFVVERFTLEETARILALGAEETQGLLAEARDGLARRRPAEVLIIEDEPLIALDIARIVKAMGHQVVGAASTHKEAVEIARSTRPGIVLADIQLADGSSGIEAAREILESMEVPVVFVTAYPERLLTGEGREPTFLVTKPFDEETLSLTIDQALLFTGGAKPLSRVG